MRYYIYLLQIFGGGNPKIYEIIRAYGSAKAVYERVSKGDMTLIPSNRIENVRKASLDKSDKIIKFCKDNKIDIITIDDKAYPVMLKNIYNPPTVLFVEGDLSCLKNHFSLSIVGPRRPEPYAVRLGVNICGGLAGCKTVLVSGFADGIDSIAHTECIKRNVPTVAVLACGHTVEYPARSFGMRAQVKKSGGAVISELLPDTQCCREYFKHRNRIISGLSYGTVVVGGENKSGSLLTANNAFDQDRDLFFTMPPDTLDGRYSKIIRFLRDGAHPVYDFYDVINEYYETHKDKLDDTHLDKNRLTSYSRLSEIITEESYDMVDEALGNDKIESDEKQLPAVEENEVAPETPEEDFEVFCEKTESEPVSENKNESKRQDSEPSAKDVLKEIVDKNTVLSEETIKSAPSDKKIELEDASQTKTRRRKDKNTIPRENRFVYKARGEEKPSVDYSDGTPSFFRRKGKKDSKKSVSTDKKQEESIAVKEPPETIAGKILDILEREEAVTREKLMSLLGVDFATMTEYLADLEVDGAITYHPGGVYTLSEES